MPVHIEEIVLQARITDEETDPDGMDDLQPPEDPDEDREAVFRQLILDDCARMIRDAIDRRQRR